VLLALQGGTPPMMGQQRRTESLFYYFRLEEQIPSDHVLRMIDGHVDFSFVREQLKEFYSSTGRPSIDPEVLLRLLLVGYLYGITSERRLMDEVRMHLAYRWFTRLGFDQEIPDHSTFSKNRHGRFRQSGVFRKVFEEIVRRCLEAGLVEGRNLAVDGTLVGANASQQSRVSRERLVEVAKLSRTVQEYLTELERQNPVTDSEESRKLQEKVSTTDPDATWAVKSGPAMLGYYDNYLIDTTSRVILSVHATPALFSHEALAARRMLEHVGQFGIHPQNLAADKAYGSVSLGSWRVTFSRTFRLSIAVIRRKDASQQNIFATSQKKMHTTVPKENRYAIAVSGEVVGVIFIARQKRNVEAVHKRSHVPQVPIGDCLFIGKSQRDKQFAGWQVRLITSVPKELVTRSKLCSPNSSNRSSCARYDCDACGTSLSSFT
jgi:transposase